MHMILYSHSHAILLRVNGLTFVDISILFLQQLKKDLLDQNLRFDWNMVALFYLK